MSTVICDETFEELLVQMVKLIEPEPGSERTHWSEQDIERIKYGLQCMDNEQRAMFFERFKGYQIVNLLKKHPATPA